MAKAIKQFRYYGDENTAKNEPRTATKENYINGSVFGNCLPILQLGIQTLPGTEFVLNNATDSIRIGRSGIYELDLNGDIEIYSLQFDANSMKIINEKQAYLIVDVVYDSVEVS